MFQARWYWMAMLLLCLNSAAGAADRPMLRMSFDSLDGIKTQQAALDDGVRGGCIVMSSATRCDTLRLPATLDRFTLAMWINVTRYPDESTGQFDDNWPMSLASFVDGKEDPSGVLRLREKKLQFAYLTPDGWKSAYGKQVLPEGQWFHVALVFDGSKLSFWINGKLDNDADLAGPMQRGSALQIGRWGQKRPFLGRIDDLLLFDRALSASELAGLFSNQDEQAQDVGQPQTEVKPLPPPLYEVYPTLRVTDDAVHSLRDFLHSYSAVAPWSGPGSVDVLFSCARIHFGGRTAIFRTLSDSPGKLPLYDTGETLLNLPGTGHQALPRADGLFDLVATGEDTTFEKKNLIYLKNTGSIGKPSFAEPAAITIGGKSLDEACGDGYPSGWYIGDINGDGVEDLLVHKVVRKLSDRPDGVSMWEGRSGLLNQGKDRGYDILGNWLGWDAISYLMWAPGSRDADGVLSFAALKIVNERVPGFAVQIKTLPGNRATAIADFNDQRYILIACDIDAVLALPAHMVGDELYCDRAVNLLANNARLSFTYYPTKLSVCDMDGDGQIEVLADGNPGRISVLKGTLPGNFVEIDYLKMRGGPVSVDTLANPCRTDWDGDGRPDLIIGDSSGLLSFFPGTSDPTVYGAPVEMQSDGKTIHHLAGSDGSIQGPSERIWGYLNPTVGDWDGDGITEIITNDIRCELYLYGRTADPHVLKPRVRFTKDGQPYSPAWRTRPAIIDKQANFAGCNMPCLLHLDWDGDLAVAIPTAPGSTDFDRVIKLHYKDGDTIRLCGEDGLWGRTKLAIGDWDGDGDWDVVFGTARPLQKIFLPEDQLPKKASPCWLENVSTSDKPVFARARAIRLRDGSFIEMGAHNASPDPTDLDGDGRLDLIVGTEDGKVYDLMRDQLQD